MYDKITLSNGVRIVTERIPYVRSASLGIWVGVGSRHEPAKLSGAAHFIEHMVFKGTKTRTAAELAQFMDRVGGQVNAFTTKECTCFHGRVVDTEITALAEVLGDMLLNSKFAEADVDSERGVIFEEIDMYNDTPEDVVGERLHQNVFPKSSLARPILGKRSTLSQMTGEVLREYMRSSYVGGSIVVALSGSFTDSDIDRLRDIFSAFPSGTVKPTKQAIYAPCHISKRKALEQNHIALAFPGLAMTDERRYAMQVLSDILGGGMSSRLFQKVREERGLCYSVYSYTSAYTDGGLFTIGTALNSDSQKQALALIIEETKKFRDDGVTSQELERCKEQVRATLLMALESTSARMNRLGRGVLHFGEAISPDEVISRYEAVTADDIASLANEILLPELMSISLVGRFSADKEPLDFSGLWGLY